MCRCATSSVGLACTTSACGPPRPSGAAGHQGIWLKKIFKDPLTSRADRGLISAPWRACPVVGQPMTNLNSPMTPVGQPRLAAPAAPNGYPINPSSPRVRSCWSGIFLTAFVQFRPVFPCSSMGDSHPSRSMAHENCSISSTTGRESPLW